MMPTLQVGASNSNGLQITSVLISGDLKVKCSKCEEVQKSTLELFADQECDCAEKQGDK